MASGIQIPAVINVKARSRSLTPSPGPAHRHRYRGHRRQSFVPIDVAELGRWPSFLWIYRWPDYFIFSARMCDVLVELRARQRTFEGAYTRTAIGTLGYTVLVLKLFDERFYRSMLDPAVTLRGVC